jgi:hypothetical protein
MSDEEFWSATFTEILRRKRCWNRVNAADKHEEKSDEQLAADRIALRKHAGLE